jgi:hypothetical protein
MDLLGHQSCILTNKLYCSVMCPSLLFYILYIAQLICLTPENCYLARGLIRAGIRHHHSDDA